MRLLTQVALDCGALALGIVGALLVRYEGDPAGFGDFGGWRLVSTLLLAGACTAVLSLVLRRQWGRLRFGTFEEVFRLAIAFIGTAAVLLVLNRLPSSRLLPDSVVLGGAALGFVAACGIRFGYRMFDDRRRRPAHSAAPVIVFGAGQGGEQTVLAMMRDPASPYRPVAMLDDDPNKRNYSVRGVRVVGNRNSMADVANQTGASTLVVAIPRAGSELMRELANLALAAGLEVKALPPVDELFGGTIGVGDIRPVTEADLLGRDVVHTDLHAISEYLTGRRVLVTGAGGSIGSEICRQVSLFTPAELVMLDRDESALHRLQLDIEGRAMLDSRNLVVADIRDTHRMHEVFAEHRPEVVFHAAALKHLPLLEMHPNEAFKSNVLGTKSVLEAARAVGVPRFVNISTDKAADPCSILGYSKRVAESLTATVARETGDCYVSVRFGNVLGSRGSVLTAFHAQVEAGGPITVTDPDVTRYFMTVTEAVHLVVQAGAVGRPGEALVLDMGEPVRIDDVAKQLAAQAPRPIQIVYTGLRPGEKLHEVLLGEHEVDRRPSHPLISQVVVPPLDGSDVSRVEVGCSTDDEVRELLTALCEKTDGMVRSHAVAPPPTEGC